MINPKVSVLLPVFNGERFLKDAVGSILNQSYDDFEFIIVNDGSTDGTLTILNAFASSDCRIRIISRANTGLTIALNEGLQSARGLYLARMDADDISCKMRFSRQVAFLDTNPDCVAVGSWVERMDQKGLPISILVRPVVHEEIDALHINAQGGGIIHPSAMFRTQSLHQIGGYKPNWEPVEDLELFLRLAEVGKLANLGEVLLRYRLNIIGVSSTRREEQAEKGVRITNLHRSKRGLAPLPPMKGTSPESPAEYERKVILESLMFRNYATAWAHTVGMSKGHPKGFGDPKWMMRCARAFVKSWL